MSKDHSKILPTANIFLTYISKRFIACLLVMTSLFSFCFSLRSFASGTIFCPECGKQIDVESKFCMFCGCELERYFIIQKEYDTKTTSRPDIPEYIITNTVLTISGAEIVKPKSFIIDWENEKKKITKVVIKDGAVEISDSAFYSCENLEEVDLPTSLKKVGRSAFSNCKYLKHITIPVGVEIIEDRAFDLCGNLKSIDLPESLITLGDSAFFLCKKLRTISLPSHLNKIGNNAFSSSGIESITFPDSIKVVGRMQKRKRCCLDSCGTSFGTT